LAHFAPVSVQGQINPASGVLAHFAPVSVQGQIKISMPLAFIDILPLSLYKGQKTGVLAHFALIFK